jgi:hypothetical protein
LTGIHDNPCHLWFTDSKGHLQPWRNRQKLAERAWTFQEHLLVTRMIHFADTEIIWECGESLRCDCMALDYEKPEDHKASYRQALISQSSVKFDLWSSIVDTVTQRKITYGTDVLPALSGIANELQAAGAGPYLAGVWLEDFPICLLWDTQPWRSWYGYGIFYSDDCQRHVSPFIAPSWSWASLKNNAGPYREKRTWSLSEIDMSYSSLISAACSPSGKDPFGPVSDGYLEVAAPLLEVQCSKVENRRAQLGVRYPTSRYPLLRPILASLDQEGITTFKTGFFQRNQKLFCLFLVKHKKGLTNDLIPLLSGLVLFPKKGATKSAFERIGVFYQYSIGAPFFDEVPLEAVDSVVRII